MLLIEENGSILVGQDLIDRDHEEFINLLNRLDTADKSDFLELFQQLFKHTVQHFDRENMLMEQLVFSGRNRAQSKFE